MLLTQHMWRNGPWGLTDGWTAFHRAVQVCSSKFSFPFPPACPCGHLKILLEELRNVLTWVNPGLKFWSLRL